MTHNCDCEPGEFLCSEAERLWREVNYQYSLLKGQPTSFEGWVDYDTALAEYRNHIANKRLADLKAEAGVSR